LGATQRWPSYSPHITLSYKVPLDFDCDEIKPLPLPVVLEAEESRNMIDGWASINGLQEANIYNPQHNLQVSREDMPQIATAHMGEFVGWLDQQGIDVQFEKVPVSSLRSVQNEIDLDKVSDLSLSLSTSVLTKPLVISSDNYILDGHHRWLALLNRDPHFQIDAYRVNLPILKLLESSKAFPKAFFQSAVAA
jgi:hypothetical protein